MTIEQLRATALAQRPEAEQRGRKHWLAETGLAESGEAAELRLLSPDQTRRVLARLVERGNLSQPGQRKGTYYRLPTGERCALKPDVGAPNAAPESPKRRNRG